MLQLTATTCHIDWHISSVKPSPLIFHVTDLLTSESWRTAILKYKFKNLIGNWKLSLPEELHFYYDSRKHCQQKNISLLWVHWERLVSLFKSCKLQIPLQWHFHPLSLINFTNITASGISFPSRFTKILLVNKQKFIMSPLVTMSFIIRIM